MYCYCAVFSEVAKLHKLAVGKLDLFGGGGLTQCHGVLDNGLNLRRNIPLIHKPMVKGLHIQYSSPPFMF